MLVAPDSFKGTLSAARAASAIAEGWSSRRPDDTITLLPLADGGEGTLDALRAALPWAVLHDVGAVTGPSGAPTPGQWLELPGRIAVVELAQCSGLPLMQELDPLGATTAGLGEVMAAALRSGARSMVVTLGGSASTDGGMGALTALGAVLRDAAGSPIPPGGAALARAVALDRSGLLAPPPGGVTLLTDVDAPLLGPRGAAAIFGPQKGADAAQVEQLESALNHLSAVLGGNTEAPGAGAAGGTGYGLATLWRASIEPGAASIGQLSGLPAALAAADVVITGEGRFDEQSLGGKVVGHVLGELTGQAAAVIAGSLGARPEGAWAASLTELAGSSAAAMTDPEKWLRIAGARAADAL
ncbi:glycerate kinase [Glaciihabitans arcticus]|uniref:Glycerate kinase n=1 Tax=Glaciihabitans arcticus TaxID=2668039 RepID=A0A4V2JF81_9MICO|nr:glycerate kinase [Glaciihabitans arcticus]